MAETDINSQPPKASNPGFNEILGSILILFGLLLTLAIVSYDNQAAMGLKPGTVENWTGTVGHYGAMLLFILFGKASYILGPLMVYLGLRGLVQSRSEDYIPGMLGSLTMVTALSLFFHFFTPLTYSDVQDTGPISGGGALGYRVGEMLKFLFGTYGAFLVALGILVPGFLYTFRLPFPEFLNLTRNRLGSMKRGSQTGMHRLLYLLFPPPRQKEAQDMEAQSSKEETITTGQAALNDWNNQSDQNSQYTESLKYTDYANQDSTMKEPLWEKKQDSERKPWIEKRVVEEDSLPRRSAAWAPQTMRKHHSGMDPMKESMLEMEHQKEVYGRNHSEYGDDPGLSHAYRLDGGDDLEELEPLEPMHSPEDGSLYGKGPGEENQGRRGSRGGEPIPGYFDGTGRSFHFQRKRSVPFKREENGFLGVLELEPGLRKGPSGESTGPAMDESTFGTAFRASQSLEETARAARIAGEELERARERFIQQSGFLSSEARDGYVQDGPDISQSAYHDLDPADDSLDDPREEELQMTGQGGSRFAGSAAEAGTGAITDDFLDDNAQDASQEYEEGYDEEYQAWDTALSAQLREEAGAKLEMQDPARETEFGRDDADGGPRMEDSSDDPDASFTDDTSALHAPYESQIPRPPASRSDSSAMTASVYEPELETLVPPFQNSRRYKLPLSILQFSRRPERTDVAREIEGVKERLESVMRDYGIQASVVHATRGPMITQYEVRPEPGVRVNRLLRIQDEIRMHLAAHSVRIVAPIPGKNTIGIELPNSVRETVTLGDLARKDENFFAPHRDLGIALGKDIAGSNLYVDLARLPHLLIAGATGSGKSVYMNSVIASILYNRSPEEVRFLMVDPKMVELKLYEGIPHLLYPVITDVRKASRALQWAVSEMERRYQILSRRKVRDIRSFNQRVAEGRIEHEPMPYVVVLIDELSDLMMVSAKDVEDSIIRLTQKARAVGIHLIMATQRPSVDVITALIKANCPARIAFQVAQKTDSRVILDSNGAESLLGRGDMLYKSPTAAAPVRIQSPMVSEEEIEDIVREARKFGSPNFVELPGEDMESEGASEDVDSELLSEAWKIILESGKTSTSYVQRRLRIGYNRAANLIENLEHMGYLGPALGNRPREILKRD